MSNYNSSSAYKMRNENGTSEKIRKNRPERHEPERSSEPRKRIKPNMTVRLNRKYESKRALPKKPLVRPFRSFDAGQIRLLFAGGFAFFVLMSFFAFTIGCQVRNNELTSLITQRKNSLSNLKNDYSGLVVARRQKLENANLEEYAEQNLGMKKRENHQIVWFEVDWDNNFDD